ncbi:MAG: hypothetical protein ACO3RK_08245 [Luteolibacter sp.]
MENLAPNDRVVAVNTNLAQPVYPGKNYQPQLISFADWPLRHDRVYHVLSVENRSDGGQAVFITGTRVFLGGEEIPWDGSRFRKVDCLKGHVPLKRRKKQPSPKSQDKSR